MEPEYELYSTQTLSTNFEVATGHVICPTVGNTRTEADFVEPIVTTVETDPQAQWTFVCNQLNTHKAATLAQAIAQQCFIPDDLGVKGQSGMKAWCGYTCRFFAGRQSPYQFCIYAQARFIAQSNRNLANAF